MEPRYERNHIHISAEEQEVIKHFKVLIAGCGIGSCIAECLLRLGFQNLLVVDGDDVELSNLNRQNYIEADIGKNKAEVLRERLLAINSAAKIVSIPHFITAERLNTLKLDCNVAINALDFSSKVPFLFDEVCRNANIPVIHPYNLGWAAFATVITSQSRDIQSLENNHKVFELNVGAYIAENLKGQKITSRWLEDFLSEYQKNADTTSPPQLSIGLSLLSGMVSHIIFNIATGRKIKEFPESYYLSIKDD